MKLGNILKPSKLKIESEKDIEKYLVKRMNLNGGLCYKWTCPNNRGVPDRICIFPSSLVRFVECKSEGFKLSKLQLIFSFRLLNKTNHKIYLLDTKASVDAFIVKHFKEINK